MAAEPKKKEVPIIDKLTPEQEALLPKYAARFLERGTTTKKFTDIFAKNICKDIYEVVLKEKFPDAFEVHDGPMSAWKSVVKHFCPDDPDAPLSFIWPYLDGHYSAGYFAWLCFLEEQFAADLPDEVKVYQQTIDLGLIFPLENACIVVQTPIAFHANESGLHRDGGPALAYGDGYKAYALNNVTVPDWLAETEAEKLDAKQFAKIQNVEVRREFIRKMGIERMLGALEHKCLDTGTDIRGGAYELLQVDIGLPKDDNGNRQWGHYLKMLNPSEHVFHMEGVPATCLTVEAALTFRNGSTLRPTMLT